MCTSPRTGAQNGSPVRYSVVLKAEKRVVGIVVEVHCETLPVQSRGRILPSAPAQPPETSKYSDFAPLFPLERNARPSTAGWR